MTNGKGAERKGKSGNDAVQGAEIEKEKISKIGGKEGESLECALAFESKGKEVRFQRVLPYSNRVFVSCIVFWETR